MLSERKEERKKVSSVVDKLRPNGLGARNKPHVYRAKKSIV